MSVVARAEPRRNRPERRHRRSGAVVFLLPFAVAGLMAFGSGCGSDVDPSKYVDNVNDAQTAFARTFQGLQSGITPNSSAADDRATLAKFQRAIAKVVAQLKSIEPPEEAADLHKDLIAEISQYGTTIQRAQAKFASNSPQEILAAQNDLSASVNKTAAEINTTIDKINDKLH